MRAGGGLDSGGAMDEVAGERQLAALEERLVALQATNARLVEEVAALRQDQALQRDVLTKIEREMRRARRLRLIGAIIRWLIFLAIIAAILYFFGDWFTQWQRLLQLLV